MYICTGVNVPVLMWRTASLVLLWYYNQTLATAVVGLYYYGSTFIYTGTSAVQDAVLSSTSAVLWAEDRTRSWLRIVRDYAIGIGWNASLL